MGYQLRVKPIVEKELKKIPKKDYYRILSAFIILSRDRLIGKKWRASIKITIIIVFGHIESFIKSGNMSGWCLLCASVTAREYINLKNSSIRPRGNYQNQSF